MPLDFQIKSSSNMQEENKMKICNLWTMKFNISHKKVFEMWFTFVPTLDQILCLLILEVNLFAKKLALTKEHAKNKGNQNRLTAEEISTLGLLKFLQGWICYLSAQYLVSMLYLFCIRIFNKLRLKIYSYKRKWSTRRWSIENLYQSKTKIKQLPFCRIFRYSFLCKMSRGGAPYTGSMTIKCN